MSETTKPYKTILPTLSEQKKLDENVFRMKQCLINSKDSDIVNRIHVAYNHLGNTFFPLPTDPIFDVLNAAVKVINDNREANVTARSATGAVQRDLVKSREEVVSYKTTCDYQASVITELKSKLSAFQEYHVATISAVFNSIK